MDIPVFGCLFFSIYLHQTNEIKIEMLTQEEKEKNLHLFLKKVREVCGEQESFSEDLISKLQDASFTHSNEYGYAFDGSLLEVVLKKLTPYAVRLNELLPENKRADKDSLVKVCLLHQISKAVKLVKNDNQWEIEKRGFAYKYDNTLPSLRTGIHSLVLSNLSGITFTPGEAEAMIIIDRDPSDDQARWHSSTLSTIVKLANEMVYTEIKAIGG